MTKGSILIIDDEEKLRKLLSRILELDGYTVFQSENGRAALQIIEENKDIEVVVSDVKLPDTHGLNLLETIKSRLPFSEIIMLTAYGTINDGVKAMKLGAFDYITKGNHDEEIIVVIEKAFEKVKLHKRVQELENKLETRYNFSNIIGDTPIIKTTVSLAQKVAPTDSTVLLIGETGTGKELFAQSIHNFSLRKNKSFVAVNCSAFPRELLESEMFGHKKGAFTGATFDKKGLFEEAHEGTLFLDEIGDMSADLQAKLLRVIEEQSFTRIGETKPKKVNVRIIAATNRDLEEECKNGNFRNDLYYRLSVFKIRIPSLRERKEDIKPLTDFFINYYSEKIKKRISGCTPAFIDKLNFYDWKGNTRELKNVLERAVILCDSDLLSVENLPAEIRNFKGHSEALYSLEKMEKEHIRNILTMVDGNKVEASRILQIGLTTLYRKIHEYGLE